MSVTLVHPAKAVGRKRGRPHRERTDDIVEWCGENLQELSGLSHLALDRNNWQKMVKQASDVNVH